MIYVKASDASSLLLHQKQLEKQGYQIVDVIVVNQRQKSRDVKYFIKYIKKE